MTDQVISENLIGDLNEENKEFLKSVEGRVSEIVEEFSKHLLDIEKRVGFPVAIERDFHVSDRVVRFSVELLPEESADIEELLDLIDCVPCDCPPGVCKEEEEEQLALPLEQPKKEDIN